MKLTTAEIERQKADEKFLTRFNINDRYISKFNDDPEYQEKLWAEFWERQAEDYLWG